MLVAGVDDAGRGCVIGPLVIAGVLMKEEDLPKLSQLGVRDSKILSPHRREILAAQIKRLAEKYSIEKLTPRQIDEVVLTGKKLRKLNWLEAKTMARVIEELRPDVAYVDASDVVERRFGQDILDCLPFELKMVSEHKADSTYPIVSAASIIAKVERDREISELAKAYGDFGSGYPSDPRTIQFLEQCLRQSCDYPDFVRKSWKPAKKAKSDRDSHQARLA
jgi:ribonuclease HII